jgi:hypothetical protein
MIFDRYTLLAALLIMALIATLRVSLGPLGDRLRNPLLRTLTHPGWMVPLMVVVNLSVGLYFSGSLSPWPPAAYADYALKFGTWAGISAFVAALTTDIWLLWAPTQVLRRFAAPQTGAALKYLQVFNTLVGAAVITLALHH